MVSGFPGVGHDLPAGSGPRNAFGLAFAAASYVWTPALCNADSDGDGFSNGAELLDPSCVWSEGKPNPGPGTVYHPGLASNKPPPPVTPAPPTPAPSETYTV